MTTQSRRHFISTAAVASMATGCHLGVPSDPPEVIDCHTHLYDPTRPQGVPWPSPKEKQLYRTVLPPSYKALAVPLGITGTVVVEASEWVADNDWVLDLAAGEPFIRGLVGNLDPVLPSFANDVKRLARNPLFRGIRIRGAHTARLHEPTVLGGLKLLADHDLALDTNGGADLLPSIARLAREIPRLRIIIDHVANLRIDGKTPPEPWLEGMRIASARQDVFCKTSGFVEGSGIRRGAPSDVEFYRPVLDHVWNCFGEDRLVYGSNWPVSELYADLPVVHSIVQTYFAARGSRALRKVFSTNCHRFYRPVKR